MLSSNTIISNRLIHILVITISTSKTCSTAALKKSTLPTSLDSTQIQTQQGHQIIKLRHPNPVENLQSKLNNSNPKRVISTFLIPSKATFPAWCKQVDSRMIKRRVSSHLAKTLHLICRLSNKNNLKMNICPIKLMKLKNRWLMKTYHLRHYS